MHPLLRLSVGLTLATLLSAPCLAQCDVGALSLTDAELADNFGEAIAIDDGWAIVGMPLRDGVGTNSGLVEVFRLDQGAWTHDARLASPHPGHLDAFGIDVAISGDTIVVGAYGDDLDLDQVSNAGAVFVFEHIGGDWVLSQELRASDAETGDQFGQAVSIDGDLLVVGAPREDAAGSNAGSVYVFERVGGAWQERKKLQGSQTAGAHLFGASLDVDGNTFAVGREHGGAVYVFTKVAILFVEQARIAPPVSAGAFGSALALNGDRLVIGAYTSGFTAYSAGAVYVFDRQGALWTETTRLLASDGTTYDYLGYDVALEGSVVVAGAYNDASTGSAYVYREVGGAFQEETKLLPCADLAPGAFGQSLALSGGRLLVADPGDDELATDAGAVGTFEDVSGFVAGGSLHAAVEVSATSGGSFRIRLDFGAAHGGELYLVLSSISGTKPGLQALGQTLPLNLDPVLLYTAGNPNTPPFSNTFGFLDGVGSAEGALALPAGAAPAFAGIRFDQAAILIDPVAGTGLAVSEPEGFTFLP